MRDDLDIMQDALRSAMIAMRDQEATMRNVANTGGNAYITQSAADAIADNFATRAQEFSDLGERLEYGDVLITSGKSLPE